MKRFIDVGRGEIMAGQGEVVLKSKADRACLVIVAYDAAKKIGGLAHAMFLGNGLAQKRISGRIRDAAGAIDEMLKDMTLLGASRNDIEVSLVTGENVPPHSQDDPDYTRNIDSAIEILKKKNVRIKDNTAHDVGPMHVSLDVASGNILCG